MSRICQRACTVSSAKVLWDQDCLQALGFEGNKTFLVLQLLQRLLEDRRPSIETVIQEGPHLAEGLQGNDSEKTKVQLSQLKLKWEALLQGANSRLVWSTMQPTLVQNYPLRWDGIDI